MEKVKLGDVCKVQGGYAFKSKEFQKDSIPIIRIGNIQDNEVEIDYNVCFTKEFLNKHPEFEIKYGDILIAMSGATVGKIGKYQNDTKALLNQRVGNFIVTEKLEKRYLYFLLQSPLFEKFILNNAFGCAQPNISSKQIEGFEFYNYDNVEQIEIANQLDKVQEIIDFRKKQIQELDELIKSQFVEMFGDVKNQKKIKDIYIFFSRGKSPNYVEKSNIGVINQACIYWNEFRFSNIKYQDELKISNSKEKMINNRDILITSTGTGTLGRCNVYNGENGKYLADGHVSILRVDEEIINPIFFKYYFMQERIQKKLYSECVNGSTSQIELSKDKFLNFNVIIPNLKEQKQFENIVQQIDKQKFEIQKSLEETQKLQESLMNKYFG